MCCLLVVAVEIILGKQQVQNFFVPILNTTLAEARVTQALYSALRFKGVEELIN